MNLKKLLLCSSLALLASACGGGIDADFTDSPGSGTTGGIGGTGSGTEPGTVAEPRQVRLVGPLLAGFEVVQSGGSNQVPDEYRSQITDSDGMFFLHPNATDMSVRIGKTVVVPSVPNLSSLFKSQTRIATRGLLFGGYFRTGKQTINGLRVLYSMDDDGIPANGFQVSARLRAAAATVAFDVSPLAVDFETDPIVASALRQLTALTGNTTRPVYESKAVVAAVDAMYLNELRTGILKFKGSFAAAPGVLENTVQFRPDGTVSFGQLGCTSEALLYSVEYEEWISESQVGLITRLDDRPDFWVKGELTMEQQAVCDSLGKPYVSKFEHLVQGLEAVDSEVVHGAYLADPESDFFSEDVEYTAHSSSIEIHDPVSGHTSHPKFFFSAP